MCLEKGDKTQCKRYCNQIESKSEVEKCLHTYLNWSDFLQASCFDENIEYFKKRDGLFFDKLKKTGWYYSSNFNKYSLKNKVIVRAKFFKDNIGYKLNPYWNNITTCLNMAGTKYQQKPVSIYNHKFKDFLSQAFKGNDNRHRAPSYI